VGCCVPCVVGCTGAEFTQLQLTMGLLDRELGPATQVAIVGVCNISTLRSVDLGKTSSLVHMWCFFTIVTGR
jgi:hypothetical protein